MPTRFTWLHGLYASQAAGTLLDNSGDWPTCYPTVAEALQQEGYRTALIGKLHSLGGLYHRDVAAHEGVTRRRGFHEAFEVCGKSLAYWYDCRWTRHLRARGLLERYRADVASRTVMIGGEERCEASFLAPEDHMDGFIARHAAEWLAAYDDERPFFLHASLCGPHFPLDPSARFLARYRPEEMPPPPGVEDPDAVRRWQAERAAYCGLLEQTDAAAGQILEALEASGRAAETLVIVTTDHGDMIGDQDLTHKAHPYDTSMRTPVTLRWPGRLPAGEVRTGPVEAVDLPATLLAAAGVEGPADAALPASPGRSYLAYARGDASAPRAWAYSECRTGAGAWRLVADERWKYVHRAEGEPLLFDRESDPEELHNLGADPAHAARRAEMQGRLLRSIMAAPAPTIGAPGPGTYSRRDL
jgi:choline-sulfatase